MQTLALETEQKPPETTSILAGNDKLKKHVHWYQDTVLPALREYRQTGNEEALEAFMIQMKRLASRVAYSTWSPKFTSAGYEDCVSEALFGILQAAKTININCPGTWNYFTKVAKSSAIACCMQSPRQISCSTRENRIVIKPLCDVLSSGDHSIPIDKMAAAETNQWFCCNSTQGIESSEISISISQVIDRSTMTEREKIAFIAEHGLFGQEYETPEVCACKNGFTLDESLHYRTRANKKFFEALHELTAPKERKVKEKAKSLRITTEQVHASRVEKWKADMLLEYIEQSLALQQNFRLKPLAKKNGYANTHSYKQAIIKFSNEALREDQPSQPKKQSFAKMLKGLITSEDFAKTRLSKEQQEVVSMRLGLGNKPAKSFAEISSILSLDDKKVRLCFKSGIDRLKKWLAEQE